MKLEHIAINVVDELEIASFYIDVLGMSKLKNFTISKGLSEQIFNIPKEAVVYLMQKEEIILEIFVTKKQYKQGFRHICISVKNREELVKKAEQKAYECTRIKREFSDLVFIRDKSGNIFEIK